MRRMINKFAKLDAEKEEVRLKKIRFMTDYDFNKYVEYKKSETYSYTQLYCWVLFGALCMISVILTFAFIWDIIYG